MSITSSRSPFAVSGSGTCRRAPSRMSTSSADPPRRRATPVGPCRPSPHRRRRSPRARSPRELGPVQAEPVHVVHRQGHRALQRRRRRQPGTQRHRLGDVHVEAADGVACLPQRPQHPGDVARPSRRRPGSDGVERHRDVVGLPVVGGRAVRGEQLVRARRRRDDRALGDRERQAEALGVVDVLPDEVDPPRRGPGARRHEPAARSRSAICSGVASLIHAPMPDSDPARNFSFPGALRSENSCRCSRVRSRPVWIGAWCHPAM